MIKNKSKVPEISVIVSCFNHEKWIERCLRSLLLQEYIKHSDYEVIIIDDCSTDNSLNEIEKIKVLFDDIVVIKHKKNLGKGAAIKSSKNYISGDIVVIQDADLEYEPEDILKLIKPIINKECLVVYGSRVLNKNYFENIQNFSHWFRILGNVFLTKLSNLINNQNLTDAHTCYKMIRARLFKKLNLREKGFAFCPEVTTKLSKMNCKIYEISISYNGRTYSDGKKITSIDGLIALISLIKYRLLD